MKLRSLPNYKCVLALVGILLFQLLAVAPVYSQVPLPEARADSTNTSLTNESPQADSLDLKQLVPKFGLLFGGSLNADPSGKTEKNLAGQRLSALFVAILIVLFLVFLVILIYQSTKASSSTRWASRLIGSQSPESIASKRQELFDKASNSKSPAAHLWREFDESLIEVTSGNKNRLFNTLDSAHFFNSNTLASGITNNRLLAAVPGFLTAFGVVGTFIGLQLGLAGLHIEAGYSTSELRFGLANVIDGAKIAFITSVWGVSLSVVFNFIEKTFEGAIRGKIDQLQVQIDNVFPRLSAEFQLQKIAEDSRESRESLQGLAEKIGNKMQESLMTATSEIEAALVGSLEKIMKPAIDSLVNDTSESSQKAMDTLLERFLERFGESGEDQKKALLDASERLNGGLSGLSGVIDNFMVQLHETQGRAADREQNWSEEMATQLRSVVGQNEEQRKQLTNFVEGRFNKLVDVLESTQTAADQRDQERSAAVERQASSMVSATEKLMGQVQSSLEDQLAASELIIGQGRSLQQTIADSVSTSNQANESLRETAIELGQTVERLTQFGTVLSRDIEDFGNSLKSASGEIERAAIKNQDTTGVLQRLADTITEAQASAQKATEELNSLMVSANTSFSTMRGHQDEFLNSLKSNVSELAAEMSKLLRDYAEQANSQTEEHLGVWARHTTQYAESMNRATSALAGVVDDIENRMNP